MARRMEQNQRRTPSRTFRVALWAMVIAAGVLANEVRAQEEEVEPSPARVRVVEGAVNIEGVHERERFAATVNLSLFPGDVVETEAGRAELHLPDQSLVWLAEESQVGLTRLGSPSAAVGEGTVLSLRSGTITVDYDVTDEASEGDLRVDTPEASVYLLEPGRFRIDSQRGTTSVTSWRGVAELAGDQGSVLIRGGQRSQVEYAAAPTAAWEVNVLRLDDFDEWCDGRADLYVREVGGADEEEYVEELPSSVRPYAAELEYYGDWRFMVDFGWVWRPHFYSVGWRPYYEGYWRWSPYGWTWIAYEPWGWAPYHYGRWYRATSVGWVWIPGAVYSGAWVSWAVTPTYIGWCPLDYYNRPAYVHVAAHSGRVRQYGGAWNFLPYNRFRHRSGYRQSVRAHHVPDLEGAVVTRNLPSFQPRILERRPEAGRKLYRDVERSSTHSDPPRGADRRGLRSFRDLDGREKATRNRTAGRRRPPTETRRGNGPVSPQGSRSYPKSGEIKTPATDRGSRGVTPTPAPREERTAPRSRPAPRQDEKPGKPTVDRRTNPQPRRMGDSRGKSSRPLPDRPKKNSSSEISPRTKDPSKRVLRRIFPDRKKPAPGVERKQKSGRETITNPKGKNSSTKGRVTKSKGKSSRQKTSPKKSSRSNSSRGKASKSSRNKSGKKK